jgi:hypothetical protein
MEVLPPKELIAGDGSLRPPNSSANASGSIASSPSPSLSKAETLAPANFPTSSREFAQQTLLRTQFSASLKCAIINAINKTKENWKVVESQAPQQPTTTTTEAQNATSGAQETSANEIDLQVIPQPFGGVFARKGVKLIVLFCFIMFVFLQQQKLLLLLAFRTVTFSTKLEPFLSLARISFQKLWIWICMGDFPRTWKIFPIT